MKSKFLLASALVSLFLCFESIETLADSTFPNKSTDYLYKKNPPKKHRAPSCAYIEYEYTGTGICLYPLELFSTVELNVYGGIDNNSWTETLSMDNGYYLETGTLNGTYFISATTDDGSVYQGELTVE